MAIVKKVVEANSSRMAHLCRVARISRAWLGCRYWRAQRRRNPKSLPVMRSKLEPIFLIAQP